MIAAVVAVGISTPPKRPCNARNTIIDRMSHAIPHSMLAMVNPAAPMVTSQRVDRTRLSQAASGITMMSPIRYDVWTQLISSGLADSPPPISSIEADTIWMSRKAMKQPRHRIANAIALRRGDGCGTTTAAVAVEMTAPPEVSAFIAERDGQERPAAHS